MGKNQLIERRNCQRNGPMHIETKLEPLRKNCGQSKGRALLPQRRRSSVALPGLSILGHGFT